MGLSGSSLLGRDPFLPWVGSGAGCLPPAQGCDPSPQPTLPRVSLGAWRRTASPTSAPGGVLRSLRWGIPPPQRGDVSAPYVRVCFQPQARQTATITPNPPACKHGTTRTMPRVPETFTDRSKTRWERSASGKNSQHQNLPSAAKDTEGTSAATRLHRGTRVCVCPRVLRRQGRERGEFCSRPREHAEPDAMGNATPNNNKASGLSAHRNAPAGISPAPSASSQPAGTAGRDGKGWEPPMAPQRETAEPGQALRGVGSCRAHLWDTAWDHPYAQGEGCQGPLCQCQLLAFPSRGQGLGMGSLLESGKPKPLNLCEQIPAGGQQTSLGHCWGWAGRLPVSGQAGWHSCTVLQGWVGSRKGSKPRNLTHPPGSPPSAHSWVMSAEFALQFPRLEICL